MSKLRMLHAQIGDTERRKTGIKWKLNLGAFSAERNSERESRGRRNEMVKRVVAELEDAGQIGTTAEPNLYIKGVMPMRWGLYNDGGARPDEEPPLVYFGGYDPDMNTLVGLGGSSKHVVGHEGATSTYSGSVTPSLVAALIRGFDNTQPDYEDLSEHYRECDEPQVYQAMAIAQHYLRPPTQQLEFVAKTLMTCADAYVPEPFLGVRKTKAILGSPLYVAIAAPLPEPEGWGLDDNQGAGEAEQG